MINSSIMFKGNLGVIWECYTHCVYTHCVYTQEQICQTSARFKVTSKRKQDKHFHCQTHFLFSQNLQEMRKNIAHFLHLMKSIII